MRRPPQTTPVAPSWRRGRGRCGRRGRGRRRKGPGAAPTGLAAGSLGTPEPGAARATRLRWAGCRCRRTGLGRRHHLRRRCCFPRVCRWGPRGAGRCAGLGFPFAFGGLPKAAAMGAAAGVGGAAASKYASRLKVVSRPPAAGYPAEQAASSAPGHPVPAGAYPMNGHAPPGYRPAIVYLPTNGHEPAKK